MINSTVAFGSESASFLLVRFSYMLFFLFFFFLANGNFLFPPFSDLV